MSCKTISLGDYIVLQRGFDLPNSKRIDGEFAVVASTGTVARHNEYKVDCPGVVIGRSGSIGGGQYITEPFWPLNTTLWVKDFKNHPPRFVYYILKSIDFSRFNSGGAVPSLNRNLISHIQIPDLGVEREEKISEILGNLDDKIANNNRINQTLEEMAQTLFKSWFVDFEPVKAKMQAIAQGNDPQIAAMEAISGKTADETENFASYQYDELRATADLFPDNLVESELGLIPEEWTVKSLNEIIEVNPRRTLKKGTLAPFLDMKNMPTKGHLANDVVLRELTSGIKFMNGDTLLARITPCLQNGKTAFVDFLNEKEIGWGSTEYIVMRSKSPLSIYISYLLARQESFRFYAIKSMTGTSGRQRASSDSIEKYLICLPLEEEINNFFDKIVRSFFSQIKNNGEQNRVLENTRDTLLPKLLSGKIEI